MTYKAKEAYKKEEIAREYDAKRFKSFKGRMVDRMEKTLITKAIRMSKITAPAMILDLPCGTGRLTRYLAEKNFQVTGVDISPEMIEQSKRSIENSTIKQRVNFLVGNAEALPFPSSHFNIGISLRLFGHLPPEYRHAVLKEMCRVSKSHVILAYYHNNSLQNLMRRKKRAKRETPWYPVDLEQIDEELEAANLKLEKKYFMLPFISETLVILARKVRPDNF